MIGGEDKPSLAPSRLWVISGVSRSNDSVHAKSSVQRAGLCIEGKQFRVRGADHDLGRRLLVAGKVFYSPRRGLTVASL